MGLWYEGGGIAPLLGLSADRVLCLDTETTGLNPHVDEILQIALVRGDGNVLMNRYVRPEAVTRWDSAQRIHGISPDDVANCLPIAAIRDEMEDAFKHVDLLVGFNVSFDLAFLRERGFSIESLKLFDVMKEYAPVAGRWDSSRRRYAWPSLSYCAACCGYRYQAHDALEDARATLHCFWTMLGQGGQEKRLGRTYLSVVERHAGALASPQGKTADIDTQHIDAWHSKVQTQNTWGEDG